MEDKTPLSQGNLPFPEASLLNVVVLTRGRPGDSSAPCVLLEKVRSATIFVVDAFNV